MDTLTIQPTVMITYGSFMSVNGEIESGSNINVPINHPGVILISSAIGGTRTVDGDATVDYPRIGFYPQTADYSITAVDDDDNPIELSDKTYIDAYGRLHIGPEVKVGTILVITSVYWPIDPSTGDGFSLTGGCTVTIIEPATYGNQNSINEWPYLQYMPLPLTSPASGEFGFTLVPE